MRHTAGPVPRSEPPEWGCWCQKRGVGDLQYVARELGCCYPRRVNDSKQIQLPTFDGVTVIRTTASWGLTVNAYLLRRGGTVALIDSGFPTRTEATLEALSAAGVAPGDVDMVLYTHSHVDHMGGGVALAEQLTNAEHVFWEGTLPATTNYHAYYAELPRWQDWLREELPATATRDALVEMFEGPPAPRHGSGVLPRQRALAFGESIRVGDLQLECVDGRGHDPFHAAWLDRDQGWLFSGDVVLRSPTPILPMLRDELTTYRNTLMRWSETLPVSVLFPGHGRPTRDFEAACAKSLGHCRTHYENACAGLAQGPAFVTDLVADARSNSVARQRRSFVEVGTMASQLGELQARGLVERLADGRWSALGTLPTYERFVDR